MLPVSADHPAIPPVQYPGNNPPFLPNITVMPEAQSLLVHAAAMVANEAGLTSGKSNARMFCYNILCSSGWANTAFAEVVKMACDDAVLKTRMGQVNSPSTALIDSVREILALYTSVLVISYPDLARVMDPQTVSTANQYAVMYQERMNLIEGMYAQSVPFRPHIQGAHPQAHMARNTQMNAPMVHGSMNRGMPHANVQQAHSNKAAAGVLQSRTAAPVQNVSASRFPSVGAAKTVAPEPTQVNAVQEEKNVIKGEIESMDREAHSIVYFGKKYDVPTSPLRRKLEEAVEQHEALAAMTDSFDSPFIHLPYAAEASLDELIAATRAKRCQVSKDNLGVYLGYGFVVTPIISPVDISQLFLKLNRSQTFSETASIMMEHLDAIKDKDELRVAISYISQMDRILTKLLNDFLENMINTQGASIKSTSFIEDAPTMPRYLNEKFKGKYNTVYTEYQRRVLDHMFKHTRALGDEEDAAAWDVSDYGDNCFWENMLTSYSVAYVSATAQELGYSVGKGTKGVSALSTPMFSRLIQAIQRTHSKHTQPSHHLIVTSDDVRYMLFQVAGGDHEFTIKEL